MTTKPKENPKRGLARGLWELWKRTARKIGDFQARVLLFVFYFTIFCPFALAVRWGSDPLSLKAGTRRSWLERGEHEGSESERARRQF